MPQRATVFFGVMGRETRRGADLALCEAIGLWHAWLVARGEAKLASMPQNAPGFAARAAPTPGPSPAYGSGEAEGVAWQVDVACDIASAGWDRRARGLAGVAGGLMGGDELGRACAGQAAGG